jgi:post-segregation antitoxin (ccd killing protein)
MRMARVNVYIPDELLREAREAKLNISSLTQEAITTKLKKHTTREWLDSLKDLPRLNISHEEVMKALDEGREDLWGPEVWGPNAR